MVLVAFPPWGPGVTFVGSSLSRPLPTSTCPSLIGRGLLDTGGTQRGNGRGDLFASFVSCGSDMAQLLELGLYHCSTVCAKLQDGCHDLSVAQPQGWQE